MNNRTILTNTIKQVKMSDRRRKALEKAAKIEINTGKPTGDKKIIAAMNDGMKLICADKLRTDDAYTILQRYGFRGERQEVMKEFLAVLEEMDESQETRATA